ncbi:MAG: carbamate kinase [Phycisphaerae bacterium]
MCDRILWGMRTNEAPIVVALGGNAVSREGEEGNIPQQFANSRETAVRLVKLVSQGHHIVVTHGNGPQVGNVLRRVELASKELYPLPLDSCGADTQGAMGYMIGQCLNNEFRRCGIDKLATAIVTTVEVDRDDPAFANPTKPIGRFYPADEAQKLKERQGWHMIEIRGHGFRRVVPSPLPRRIVEIDLIRRLVAEGQILIVAGGGGIPVTRNADGDYAGCEAVIDKDRTSAILAREVDAATLVIATSVERVALDYDTPQVRYLDRMTIAEARRYLDAGQFPPGSMGPKIEAAVSFLETSKHADARVVICDLNGMTEALAGKTGTRIERD